MPVPLLAPLAPSLPEFALDVAATVERPRADPPDSFVLHAPLELLARLRLLPHVGAAHRQEAEARLREIAAGVEAFGPAAPAAPPRAFADPAAACAVLVAAIDRGELLDVDAAATWLGDHAHPHELGGALVDALAPRTAAAGHAPIFLSLLPTVTQAAGPLGRLLRPLARTLALAPELRLRWFEEPDPVPSAAATGALGDRLGAVHSGPRPAQDFIHPTMALVDGPIARAAVGSVGEDRNGLQDTARHIVRVAAATMLDEPGPAMPYLWTHCLTMPFALLSLLPVASDPARLVQIAATHVVGFRSAFATRAVQPFDPPPAGLELRDALADGPEAAAAAAWHTPEAEWPALAAELVDHAAVHPDAHLVKYTVACLDAAACDPAARRLHLTAAASLAGWWARTLDA